MDVHQPWVAQKGILFDYSSFRSQETEDTRAQNWIKRNPVIHSLTQKWRSAAQIFGNVTKYSTFYRQTLQLRMLMADT